MIGYVYIMSSASRVLYIGVTNDIIRRVTEHKNKLDPDSFTAKYNCTRLVYFEEHQGIEAAIEREKQIKRYRRSKKYVLIEEMNQEWRDLAAEYFK